MIPATIQSTPSVVSAVQSAPSSGAGAYWQSPCGRATLHLGRCEDVIPKLDAPFDCVITSPPYNLASAPWEQLGHWRPGVASGAGGRGKWKAGGDSADGIDYGEHEDNMPWPDYVAWQHAVLSALWERLPEHGSIWYNHKPRVVGTRLWLPLELTPSPVILRQIVTWARPGGMNYSPVAFVPTSEWIMLLAKPEMRLRSKGASGIGDVWYMAPDRNEHPAPFPLALPSKALEAVEATVVLDPFTGSGTTAIAALRAGCRFVGIEKSPRWFTMARERIEAELRQADLLDPAQMQRARHSQDKLF